MTLRAFLTTARGRILDRLLGGERGPVADVDEALL